VAALAALEALLHTKHYAMGAAEEEQGQGAAMVYEHEQTTQVRTSPKAPIAIGMRLSLQTNTSYNIPLCM
jgi:hypothetical protein